MIALRSGSLIIIHGLVVHKSAPNTSSMSRHAFTLHIMEAKDTKWSEDNWYVVLCPFLFSQPKHVSIPCLRGVLCDGSKRNVLFGTELFIQGNTDCIELNLLASFSNSRPNEKNLFLNFRIIKRKNNLA